MQAKYGEVTYSRIGVLTKKMKDDAVKLRLMHDLRRFGVNSKVQMSERRVLPRTSDLVDDILAVYEACGIGMNTLADKE